MAYFVSTPAVKGAPGEVDTEARNAIGTEATDNSGNVYIYLAGVANTAAGSWVTYDEAEDMLPPRLAVVLDWARRTISGG